MTITEAIHQAVLKIPKRAWTPAYDADGAERPGACSAGHTALLVVAADLLQSASRSEHLELTQPLRALVASVTRRQRADRQLGWGFQDLPEPLREPADRLWAVYTHDSDYAAPKNGKVAEHRKLVGAGEWCAGLMGVCPVMLHVWVPRSSAVAATAVLPAAATGHGHHAPAPQHHLPRDGDTRSDQVRQSRRGAKARAAVDFAIPNGGDGCRSVKFGRS
ncbi:hypothetical protein ACFYXD_15175 [Streptomyces platensis]|uniref:hypothetical protein n=1 Tax=Streptomyces platensis TaxID=58346 RepID=UPI0036898CC4